MLPLFHSKIPAFSQKIIFQTKKKMTLVFVASTNIAGGYLAGKQVFPVDYEAESLSQRLVDAVHENDQKSALDLLLNPFVDVNYMGTVILKTRKSEVVLHDENPCEVRFEFDEFKTEVTPLFLAAQNGNVTLVRKLMSVGANVNQKMFRGYATTAAVREGHIEILQMLLQGGAAQPACEEALVEACYLGWARPAELLMASEMVRPHVAVHALVTSSFRGFKDFVDTLIKCGVDCNATARVLLQSSKPSLHANVDCNPLSAAIVGRQISVVGLLLQAGAKKDVSVRLGAWSWDATTGEELRVGAGMAEPYHVTWCAVEYYEASGAILRVLLQHLSANISHLGRTTIHHAVLCGNAGAVKVLLDSGADVELPVKTTKRIEFRSIHIAARLGWAGVLKHLINAGCNLNSFTESNETAVMISMRYRQEECLKVLAAAGADFGLTNNAGQSAESVAKSIKWAHGFQKAVLDVIHDGKTARSSNAAIFSSLIFVTRANDNDALKKLTEQAKINLDEQDKDGNSAVMIAATGGQVEAFRLLVKAGANLKMPNVHGETAISLSEKHQEREAFEKIMVEHGCAKGDNFYGGSSTLHRAAHRGDLELVSKLLKEGYDVNLLDGDNYTPLMLAAMASQGVMCKLLISFGAQCDLMNTRHETALSLARKTKNGKDAEQVILDELARRLVLSGAQVKKHTKGGKGSPHKKVLKMVGTTGILRWGKSNRRNVICRGAEIGPSNTFRWNRRKKFDGEDPGIFRVVTTKNKDFHFVCEGGSEIAQLWVRGIKLVTREAICGTQL